MPILRALKCTCRNIAIEKNVVCNNTENDYLNSDLPVLVLFD